MERYEIFPTRYGAEGTREIREYVTPTSYRIVATDLTIETARTLLRGEQHSTDRHPVTIEISPDGETASCWLCADCAADAAEPILESMGV